MAILERFQVALRSPQAGAHLRALAQQLASEGNTKSQVYTMFEGFLLDMCKKPEHLEKDEEVVLDVMDALTGWCHSEAVLIPDQ